MPNRDATGPAHSMSPADLDQVFARLERISTNLAGLARAAASLAAELNAHLAACSCGR
jgi:hypothetical protein